jgi:hypothetical protein
MTSATVTSNDFLAIMKERRAHAHKRIANPSVGRFVPSANIRAAYQLLRSFPVSNTDALDDAQQQIKDTSNVGATNTADTSEGDITTISNTYKNDPDNPNAQSTFQQQMEDSKTKAKKNSDDAIDAAYDKAEELGKQMTPSEQNSILSFMQNVVEKGIAGVIGEITDFIVNAVNTLVNWIKDALAAIGKTFSKIAGFIKSIF